MPPPFQPIKPVFTVISQNGRRKICKRRNIFARSSIFSSPTFAAWLLGRFVCSAHGWIDATYATCQCHRRMLCDCLLFFSLFVFLPSLDVCVLCVSRINYAFIYTTIFVLLAVQFSSAVDGQNEQVE